MVMERGEALRGSAAAGAAAARALRSAAGICAMCRQRPGRPGARSGAAGLALAVLFWATPSFAADGGKPSEMVFVGEILALLVVGRLFGEIMLRLGQPTVVGQLLAGIALGPSVFGALAPQLHQLVFPPDAGQKAMVDGVAQLGVLLLLLLTGMETDVALVRRIGRAAGAVSLTGIAVPFVCGLTLGLKLLPEHLLPDPGKRLVTAMFLGTALSISSIKIVAMVVDEMRFMRRNLGQIIVASAIIDDTVGWILIAITFGLARPQGLDLLRLAASVGGTVAFLGLSLTLGRPMVAAVMRWTNDVWRSDLAMVSAILAIMAAFALVTAAIGVQTVLGAFVAGVLVGQSPILTGRAEREIRGLVVALFAPVFFGIAGLGTNLTVLRDPTLLGLTAAFVLIASLGKFGGAFLGGTLGGLTRQECLALALGMNARGSTEVIVATIGLSIGALSGTLFTMIVTMAVLTTMAMPPTLRWALARLPLRPDEAERLQREADEETAFLGGVERLLLVRDGGASGRLAGRLCGRLGGLRALPMAVMPLDLSSDQAHAVGDVSQAAAATRAAMGLDAAADVTLLPRQVTADAAPEQVAAQLRKGYGLLALGVEPATLPTGGLHPRVARLLGSFAGPRLLAIARGSDRGATAPQPLRILVPVSGAAVSRRAAEIALSIAQAERVPVTLLFVADPPAGGLAGLAGRRTRQQPHRDELLAGLRALARPFEVEVETLVRVADDKGAAILGYARRTGPSLIVLGVQPRPGGSMPFGTLVDSLVESSEHSLLLVLGDDAVQITPASTRGVMWQASSA